MKEGHGKKDYQRMKPYIIYNYLMRNSDEAHTIKIAPERKEKADEDNSIQTYLNSLEIHAERRSVYKDIEEMNQMLLVLEGCAEDMEEAKELCQDQENCAIRYDAKSRGYYVHQRKYTLEDIRLLAECVYTAKFVSGKRDSPLLQLRVRGGQHQRGLPRVLDQPEGRAGLPGTAPECIQKLPAEQRLRQQDLGAHHQEGCR